MKAGSNGSVRVHTRVPAGAPQPLVPHLGRFGRVRRCAPTVTCPLLTMVSLPIFEFFVFAITLGIVLSVSVPLSGTLVRYRASYNPRGLALDAEGGATPHTGPIVNSYFGMMKRVYQIEVGSLHVPLVIPAAICTTPDTC